MKEMHTNQKKLLALLSNNIDDPLTIRELQKHLGVKSTSVVHHHILQLERNGYLKRNPSNPRDYQIMGEQEKPIVYINQYGLAECGTDGSILDGNPVDRIPIASRLLKFPTIDAFIVIAKGDSMEPQICEGDIIIAQQQKQADNNNIVVCVNNEETIIKKLYKETSNVILHSVNPDYKPFIAANDFRIVGVVRNILKYS